MFVIAEHQPAHPVVVAQCSPADKAGGLGRKHRLEHQARTKEQSTALFREDENRPFALFMEHFGVRLLGTGRDAPVDGAHIVTGLIHPHLVEIHPAPAQFRVMQARHRAALAGGREQLHFAHPMPHLDQFGKGDANAGFGGQRVVHRQATATTSRMRCTTRSWSMPAASASNDRMMRWRSTSNSTA